MRIKQIFSVMFASLCLSSPLLYANAADMTSQSSEYLDTLRNISQAKSTGATAHAISDMFIQGAGHCRDSGDHPGAIDLFEKGIAEDPTNVNALRVYGDYLMGYRGLYEKAADMYRRAQSILDAEYYVDRPDNIDYLHQQQGRLDRSREILHRDGKDGFPLLEGQDFQIYLKPFGEYGDVSVNDEEPYSMFEKEQAASRPVFLHTKFTIKENLPTRKEFTEFGADVLLRFSNPAMPFFGFSFSQNDVKKDGLLNQENLRSWEGRFRNFEGNVGKNFLVLDNLDLTVKAGINRLESFTRDPHFHNTEIEFQKSDKWFLDTDWNVRLGKNTLRVSVGGDFSQIETRASNEDGANGQRFSIRYSQYGLLDDLDDIAFDNPEKFRGRRSRHLEIGTKRDERKFEGNTTEKMWQPFISYEELGLFGGKFDATMIYKAYLREFTATTVHITADDYLYHQVRFIPTYIPIYRLYEESFSRGLEELRLSAPMQMSWSESDYNRFNVGLDIQGQWVVTPGLRITPSLGVDYAYYTQLNQGDFGFFAKVSWGY